MQLERRRWSWVSVVAALVVVLAVAGVAAVRGRQPEMAVVRMLGRPAPASLRNVRFHSDELLGLNPEPSYWLRFEASAEDVAVWVQRAKATFPPIEGPSPINLVSSHERRKRLNAELQEIYKQPGAIWVPEVPSNAKHNEPQAMWLWEGQELICAVIHAGLRRQCTYKIVELSDKDAVLAAPDGTLTARFTHSKVASLFRLSFARTYHAAQGLEWPRVRLWDTESIFFTKQHLIVGLSRCLDSRKLDVM